MSIHFNHRKAIFSVVVIFMLLVLTVGSSFIPPASTDNSNPIQTKPPSTKTHQPTVEPQRLNAPREPIPAQVIIQFTPNTTAKERAAYIESLGGTVVENIEALDTVVVTVPEQVAKEPLPESPMVAETEPDYYVSALDDFIPNDPRYEEQWALPAIGAPSAWAQMPSDAPQVTVAVIDSGICASHPDLSGRILEGWDFLESDAVPQDDFGHGCSVAGVIAANMDDGVGIAGVAPNAQIMPLRVLNASGVGSYSDVAAAIVYAADNGAQVINLSLGGSNPSSTLENAVNYAISKGVIVVAAAGNNGTEGALYPAAYPDVIAVGSVDPNLEHSSFSNYGSQIDIWAPGRDILTTKRDGSYGLVSGTSFAAPYVAGAEVINIVLGNLSFTNGTILLFDKQIIEAPTNSPSLTATPTPTPTSPRPDNYSGDGFTIDVSAPWVFATSRDDGFSSILEFYNYDALDIIELRNNSDATILQSEHIYLINQEDYWNSKDFTGYFEYLNSQKIGEERTSDSRYIIKKIEDTYIDGRNAVVQSEFSVNNKSITYAAYVIDDDNLYRIAVTGFELGLENALIENLRIFISDFKFSSEAKPYSQISELADPTDQDYAFLDTLKLPWRKGDKEPRRLSQDWQGHAATGFALDFGHSQGGNYVLGTDVLAPYSGTAYFLNQTSYGNVITIDTGHGWWVLVAHLDTMTDKVDTVRQVTMGEKIGTLGGSGGWVPHVHVEVRWGRYGAVPDINKIQRIFGHPRDDFKWNGTNQQFFYSTNDGSGGGGGTGTDGMTFVADVTIPDNTIMNSGQSFTKTWRIRNTGTTTWGNGYNLIFVSGSQLNAQNSITLSSTAPNSTVDLTVNMTAPSSPGTYRSNWQMRNSQGALFGNQVWAQIVVNTSGGSGCTYGKDVDSTFFGDVLGYMNMPVNQFALDAFAKWKPKENTTACWNPLATTLPANQIGDASCTDTVFNGAGVRNYSSKACGEKATAITLQYTPSGSGTYYKPIRDMLSQQTFNWQAIHDSLVRWVGSEGYATSLSNEWQTLWDSRGGTPQEQCTSYAFNGITLFSDIECRGSAKKEMGSAGFTNLPDFNDLTRSINVASGWSARVWAHNDRGEPTQCITGDKWDLSKPSDTYTNGQRIYGDGVNISSIEVFNNTNCMAPTDNAAFIGQSSYPTVDPGQSFSIYFEVRNSGTSTWQTGSYWLQNLDTSLGAGSQQGLGSNVGPNGTKRWDINMTAPSTPGTYRTQWMVNHNNTNFGPYMFIDVTVRQPSCSQLASEVRLYDQINCPSSAGKVTNGGTGLWDISGIFNDRAQSIEIPLGYSARLYKDNTEASPSVCIDNSDVNLRDNTFSDGSAVASSTGAGTTWVRIYNQDGCPLTMPSVPSNVRQTGSTSSSITISWNDVSNEMGYKVYEINGSTITDWGGADANQTSFTITGLSCGQDGFYVVTAYNMAGESGMSSSVHAYSLACPTVANDDFNNAISIASAPYSNSQTTAYATEAGDDPVLVCTSFSDKKYNTVWYRYIPNASGTLTVDTFGSGYDTVLGIWTGSRGSLAQKGCDDDSGVGAQSQLQVTVISGTTYYIEIAGFGSASEGALTLSVNLDAKPNPPTLVSPTNLPILNSRTVTFNWNASSSSNITGYIFRLSQSSNPNTQPWLVSTTTSALTNVYTFPSDGQFYWHMQTTSTNQNSDWVTRVFGIDTVAPTVAITAPISASFLGTTNQITITASASDALSGMKNLVFYVGYDSVAGAGALGGNNSAQSYVPPLENSDDPELQGTNVTSQAWSWLQLGSDANGSDGWSMTWDASAVPDQNNIAFYAYAYDSAGNVQGAGSWGVILDRTIPVSGMYWISAYSSPAFKVSWEGSDTLSGISNFDIQYQDNGGAWTNWLSATTASSATFNGTVGHTYTFRSRACDRAGNTSTYPATAEIQTTTVAPPGNDSFNAAQVFSVLPGNISLDTRGASTASDDPILSASCSDYSTKHSNSVWYKYTVPANGFLEVDTWGSDYDTVLAVWKGTAGNLTLVDCIDDNYGYFQAWLEETPVVTGTTYYIEVMDYGNPGGGNLELFVDFASSTTNNDFNTPTIINSLPYSTTQNTKGATQASDDPTLTSCNRLPGWASVWYRYTPSVNANIIVDTKGSDYDTLLAVWTGSRGSLVPAGCNDDIGTVDGIWDQDSILTVPVNAGTTYYIEASTFNGYIDTNGASAEELQGKPDDVDASANNLQDKKTEIDKNGGLITDLQSERSDEMSAQFWGGTLQLHVSALYTISGNAGVAGSTLSYTDGTVKTVTANGSGDYSIIVSSGWSGTITPYKSGYTFTPVSRSYTNVQSNQTAQDYTAQVCASCADVNVTIGGDSQGNYTLGNGEERRLSFNVSGGPVKVESSDPSKKIVTAIRLQSYVNNTLYSFAETMGVPSGLLSYKYYFPSYNNIWAPLNSQIRFSNLDANPTTIRVTIGGNNVWEQQVLGGEEKRLSFDVSGGPVIIESLDPAKKIAAAIRLQSYANNTLYSFAETMGIPAEQVSNTYYFPSYNNIWAPLNSQLRIGNLDASDVTVRVTIGGDIVWEDVVPGLDEKRLSFIVSGGPVKVESLDPDPSKKIVTAIRLQSYVNNTLYSFAETMGVPSGLLSYKYYFPSYNNIWAPLNSQIRFSNLDANPTTIRVTIGGNNVWEQQVLGGEEKRLSFDVSGGPVIIESLDPAKKIAAAIRLQSYANNTLYSFAETMGIPAEQVSNTYYFPSYNNIWAPLNSQLRFGLP